MYSHASPHTARNKLQVLGSKRLEKKIKVYAYNGAPKHPYKRVNTAENKRLAGQTARGKAASFTNTVPLNV